MNPDAFARQVVDLTKPLYYVACTLLASPHDREDALQNCIVRGLSRCESLRDESKLRPWITRILINECYTLLRQKRRLIPMEQVPEPPPAEGVDAALRDAVMALPEKRRIPLTLSLEGYTAKEIAQALRIPEGTAKTRIRDAKQALRLLLSDTDGEVLA